MSVLFKALNTAILTLGVFSCHLHHCARFISNSHEGEFMGKKWNGPWVPLRTLWVLRDVPSFIRLFSDSNHYNVDYLQGVGAADVLWTTVLIMSA